MFGEIVGQITGDKTVRTNNKRFSFEMHEAQHTDHILLWADNLYKHDEL